SELLDAGYLSPYPELERTAKMIVDDSRFKKSASKGRLTVQVFSFSYKKGYPEDLSGNGGGFMFDCRGMHNPGRYEAYKKLTGMDKPVIDFLREKGETDKFSLQAFELVSPTVEKYISRGFTNLQIGFGCTGGQHRSVYCAESVAKMLADRFPEATVVLNHREQKVAKAFNGQMSNNKDQ
ncbi:MAG: phosphotransferase, partial [Muribaculaceae bacterium]|nr:phosphotransferase [Muribaculaceae bacterium]